MFKGGRRTVSVPGVPEPLRDTPQRFSRLMVQALWSNTVPVYVGDSNVLAAAGFENFPGLPALASLDVLNGDLHDVYIDSTVAAEGVVFSWE